MSGSRGWPPLPTERSPLTGAPLPQGHRTHLTGEASRACLARGGPLFDLARRVTS